MCKRDRLTYYVCKGVYLSITGYTEHVGGVWDRYVCVEHIRSVGMEPRHSRRQSRHAGMLDIYSCVEIVTPHLGVHVYTKGVHF